MNRKKGKISNLKVALFAGCCAFAVLSFLTRGMISFSSEAGFTWALVESVKYAVLNKLGAKLCASVLVALCSGMVVSMVAYSKAEQAHRRARVARATQVDHVQFQAAPVSKQGERIA